MSKCEKDAPETLTRLYLAATAVLLAMMSTGMICSGCQQSLITCRRYLQSLSTLLTTIERASAPYKQACPLGRGTRGSSRVARA